MTSRFLYIEADTFFHRLHPNTKLLCLLLLFVAVMAFNHPIYEGALFVLSIVLLGFAKSLGNLRRSWKFFSLLFVASTVLWVLFVEIAEPTVLWSLKPALVDRGTTAYDLLMVMVIAGLLMLAIIALSLFQLVIQDLARTRGSLGWWLALVVVGAAGMLMVWKTHALVPQMWMWYVLVLVYFLMASAVVLARMRSPYALALWLALVFVGIGLYLALNGFLVHVNTEGTQFVWGPSIAISREALLFGPAMGLRIVAFLSFGLLFISTTSPEQLTQGLRSMGMPLTPSVAFSLAFRLVPTFVATARTVMDAQRARGLDLDAGGAMTRLKRTAPVILPTLTSALRSADDLTRALETRGLGAARLRTEYRKLSAGAGDVIAIVAVALVTALCVVARAGCDIGELLPRL